MDIQIINPITYPGWDNLLLTAPDYSFFHSSAWAKVLKEAYQYTPVYFIACNNNQLSALIPVMEINSFLTGKRGVSLPFTDFSDVIISDGISFESLFEHIIQYGKNNGWKSVEIRGGQSVPLPVPVSCLYSRHILDLCKEAREIFLSFRDSTRRNIKKSIRKGVKAEVSCTLDSVREFYRLNCITRKKHGLPPQPFHFFKKVYEHIISKNFGLVVLSSYGESIIAGAVYFHLGGKAVFKYGASDKKFHHLRPNNLVMWEAIKWYRTNGFRSLCFGRTELTNIGLRRFKKGWSTQEREINYHKYDLTKDTFVTTQREVSAFQKKIASKLPVPILNIVGSLLYKHKG